MRRVALLSVCVVLAACVAKETNEAGGDTMSAAGSVAPPPTAISLADVAGKWSVKVMPEVGDSVLTTYELNATAADTGWTMTFPGRPPLPLHVTGVAGDSVTIHVPTYESALRKGVNVETTSTMRLSGGKLMGTFVAKYKVTTADSVLRGRVEGTRM